MSDFTFPNLQREAFEVDRNTATIHSPVLDGFLWLSHGVTTRDFASPEIDVFDLMADIRRRLVPGGPRIFCGEQVHGDRIEGIESAGQKFDGEKAEIRGPVVRIRDIDGLITSEPSVPIAVRTADCVPLILADVRARRVAVVHAGWRGTLACIAQKAVGEMVRLGSEAEYIVAWIGPSIGRDSYEISEDLVEQFRAKFPDYSDILSGRRLDLTSLNACQLHAAGVGASQIHAANCDTAGRRDVCCSHRAEGRRAGRMVTYAMILAP